MKSRRNLMRLHERQRKILFSENCREIFQLFKRLRESTAHGSKPYTKLSGISKRLRLLLNKYFISGSLSSMNSSFYSPQAFDSELIRNSQASLYHWQSFRADRNLAQLKDDQIPACWQIWLMVRFKILLSPKKFCKESNHRLREIIKYLRFPSLRFVFRGRWGRKIAE